MSLTLTPISEAWNNTQTRKTQKQKQIVNKPHQKTNIYSSPETQSKILSDLGMMEPMNSQHETEDQISINNEIPNDSYSLNLSLNNKELVNMLKPYSNDYIEMILLNCIRNKKDTGVTKDVIDTIESIYMMITLILFLIVIEILFKLKHN